MGIPKSQLSKCVLAILLLALTNFVAGRFGLLLAISPGYSSAVFPPSGIALAAILLFGFRVWPGVFLGAFFLTICGRPDWPEIYLLAASIACGSTLQAVAGAWLIRRFVGFPAALDERRSISKFIVLGGLVSCLISATWANTTLWLMKFMTHDYAFSWFNWWVGDTVGVLIFTPLMLVLFGEPTRLWRARRLKVGVPLVVAFLGAVVVLFFVNNQERAKTEREFRQRVDAHSNALKHDMARHLEALWSIHSFLSSNDVVTRTTFQSYIQRTLTENPGVQVVGWNPLVLDSEREAFETLAKEQVDPAFEIRERDSKGKLQTSPSHDEYVVVKFIEPVENNADAVGFNVAADSIRREALEKARDTGRPVATRRLDLVQDDDDSAGILIFMPVYRKNMPLHDEEQRRRAIRGYAVNVIRINDFVANSLAGLSSDRIQLKIFDENGGSKNLNERLLYGSAEPVDAAFRVESFCDVPGRAWRLEFLAADNFELGHAWELWIVLSGGLCFMCLLCFALLKIAGQFSRVEELVEQRTKELVREQQLLHKLIELQDRERQMVALDIHDGFVQEIVGAQMLVESANHNLSDSSRAQIEKASTFLKKGIDEARRLIGDLRPMVIEEHGVVEAIKHLIADLEKQYGMTVVFVHEVEFDRLDPTLEGVIFRIVQEALRNVVHHAETQHAVVRLKQDGNDLMIEIRDSGKGFDPGAIPTSRFGVRGIQDRARIFGGSAFVESTPGEGTIVRVVIPITDQEPANLPPPEFYI